MQRLFWAAAGAVVGVAGYRKASRLARTVRAGDALSFARDVRHGMDLYLERCQQPAGPNLGGPAERGRGAAGGPGEDPPRSGYQGLDNAKGGR